MIVFIVTFILFFIEAIIHYNYGYKDQKFRFPDTESLIKIIYTVGVFSFLNSNIIRYLRHNYNMY